MAINPLTKAIGQIRRTTLSRDGAGCTDAQLLTSFIDDRDEAAFAALVRLHAPMVWGVCRRGLQSHHDAEDAFQATFLVLLRKAESVVPREMLGNWLYGVAYRTMLKARTLAAKRRGRESPMRNVPDPDSVQDELIDLQPVLDRELSRLPDKYRAAIVLCDLDGKTQKEAARQVGVPEGTLSARLARGRTMLAKRLARHGLTGSVAGLAVALAKGASAAVPAPVVSSTIKAASLIVAGNGVAAGAVSPAVSALIDGVVKMMLLNKLTKLSVVVLVLGFAGLEGLHLSDAAAAQHGQGAAVSSAGGNNNAELAFNDASADGIGAANLEKDGTFRGVVDKVDADQGTISVFRLAPPGGGKVVGPGAVKGLLRIRLENVPLAKEARINVNGKEAKLADVKPNMRIALELEVKGGIKIKLIEAEDAGPVQPKPVKG